MFKSYHKKFLTSAVVASVVLLGTACNASSDKTESKKVEAKKASTTSSSDSVKNVYANGKRVIDGGVIYPVVNAKTSSYSVNESAHSAHVTYGKTATPNEIKAWDIDVMPDGTGLPEGSGSVEDGDELYEEKCIACHGDFGSGGGGYPSLTKGNAYEAQKTLTNQRLTSNDDGPERVFGSYWQYPSTLWWYIKTGMPHPAPMSLTNDEVYAITAYILSINEIKIDGELVEDEYVLDRAKFLKIEMPNKDGFIPNIEGPKGTDNVRDFYADPKNYGNGTRCMTNCFDGEPIVQRTQGEGITGFTPPMSNKKDLPAKKAGAKADHPGKEAYEAKCKICHGTDSMGAPMVGDKASWSKRIANGMETLYKNAINGTGAMPPKGGTTLDDAKIKEIVDYMVSESK